MTTQKYFHFQYPIFNVYKKTPSLSSQPSSIVSIRYGSTEDLYCDDELQCIEHDPNMRLMDEHLLDRFQGETGDEYQQHHADNGELHLIKEYSK